MRNQIFAEFDPGAMGVLDDPFPAISQAQRLRNMHSVTREKTQVQRYLRSGDGYPIRVTRKPFTTDDGKQGFELALELSEARVPERKYFSTAAFVRRSDDSVVLAFAQKKDFEAGLRSLVVINMSRLAAENLDESCGELLPKLRDYLAANHAREVVLTEFAREPEQTVSMNANVVAVASNEMEAAMDFYFISPWSVALARRGESSQVPIEPLVRVTLSTPLLYSALKNLSDICQELKVGSAVR